MATLAQINRIRNLLPIARRHCGVYWWRIAVAVSGRESNFGTSPLALKHRNFHGHKVARPDHVRADDLGHRSFQTEFQTWRSFAYLLQESTYYRAARIAEARARRSGLSDPEIEDAIVRAMASTYCPDDPDWPAAVLEWLAWVRLVENAMKGESIP